MTDWVGQHRDSITFIVSMLVGVVMIGVGLFARDEPALVALGAGAVGLPGFTLTAQRKDDDA